MENAALLNIQATTLEAEKKRLIIGPTPDQLRILRNDEKLVALEQYANHRQRFRGTFSTPLVADFSSYVQEHPDVVEGEPVPVFIELKKLAATAIFNLRQDGEAGHGDDRAVLTLEPTAPYKNLLAVADTRQGQRELAEFIEEWAPYLQCFGEDYYGSLDPNTANAIASMPLGKVVAAIRGITVKERREAGTQVRNHGETRSVLEAIDAKGEGEYLPTVVVFTCVPYDGFAERRFELRVGVVTSDPPKVALRLIGKERHDEELGEELKAKLNANLDEKADILIGAFAVGS